MERLRERLRSHPLVVFLVASALLVVWFLVLGEVEGLYPGYQNEASSPSPEVAEVFTNLTILPMGFWGLLFAWADRLLLGKRLGLWLTFGCMLFPVQFAYWGSQGGAWLWMCTFTFPLTVLGLIALVFVSTISDEKIKAEAKKRDRHSGPVPLSPQRGSR